MVLLPLLQIEIFYHHNLERKFPTNTTLFQTTVIFCHMKMLCTCKCYHPGSLGGSKQSSLMSLAALSYIDHTHTARYRPSKVW